MTCAIRPGRADDLEQCHLIRLAVRENRLSDPSRISADDYRRHVDRPGFWVAEAGDLIVGFGSLGLDGGSLWALFVHPDHSGRGIGGALHEALLISARQRKVDRLWLTTAPETDAARFYAKRGWRDRGPAEGGDRRLELALTIRRRRPT
jgi:GNAT superfamily N-acetyltransferase